MHHPLSANLESVLAPIESARGLPNEHYTSPALFEREKHDILFANWCGIGFGKDVPSPGDVRPIEFLGLPLLLVRDQGGEIAVFQNTCRHRGMILVDEPTHIRKVLRCPYHSWCYSLDGELVATPHVGGPGRNRDDAIRNEDLGLIRFPTAVWQDVVFVNIAGQAPPFREWAAPLIDRWQEFDTPAYFASDDSTLRLEPRTNWKLAVENYCESYHLPWIHPGLNSYSKLQDHYNIECPGHFSGQGTRVYRRLTGKRGERFPDQADLSEHWDAGAEYLSLYPNVLFGVHRDHRFSIVLEPQAVDRTVEHIALYYTEPGANDPDLAELRRENSRLWDTVFREDIGVVEGMQAGRRGIRFDGGRFSPAMDAPTHCFHRWVAQQMEASSGHTSAATPPERLRFHERRESP